MRSVPVWALLLAIAGVTFVFLGFDVRRRRAKKRSVPTIWVGPPRWGYDQVDKVTYEGMKWRVRRPRERPYEFMLNPLQPSPEEFAAQLEVDGPYCPDCDTALVGKAGRFGFFRWECDSCRFSKRLRGTQSDVRNRITRIVQADARRQLSPQP